MRMVVRFLLSIGRIYLHNRFSCLSFVAGIPTAQNQYVQCGNEYGITDSSCYHTTSGRARMH